MARKRIKASETEPETETPETPETEPASERGRKEIRPNIAWGMVITETLQIPDPPGVARRLRSELQLGDGRHDYGRILEALDRSASNYEDAARLFRAAKVEETRFEFEVNERVGILRNSALAELMEEYKAKARRSPTNDDVEDRMTYNWPDEYRALKVRTAELHNAVRELETLRDAWASRCADLRIMADKARQVR